MVEFRVGQPLVACTVQPHSVELKEVGVVAAASEIIDTVLLFVDLQNPNAIELVLSQRL